MRTIVLAHMKSLPHRVSAGRAGRLADPVGTLKWVVKKT
jgi:hypothetical protein